MRLLAVIALSLVVVLHHGVPVAGHAMHGGSAASCTGPACGGEGTAHHDPGDAMGIAMACLAVLAMAAITSRHPRAMARRTRAAVGATCGHRLRPRALVPIHAPPRPLRPCVLQR